MNFENLPHEIVCLLKKKDEEIKKLKETVEYYKEDNNKLLLYIEGLKKTTKEEDVKINYIKVDENPPTNNIIKKKKHHEKYFKKNYFYELPDDLIELIKDKEAELIKDDTYKNNKKFNTDEIKKMAVHYGRVFFLGSTDRAVIDRKNIEKDYHTIIDRKVDEFDSNIGINDLNNLKRIQRINRDNNRDRFYKPVIDYIKKSGLQFQERANKGTLRNKNTFYKYQLDKNKINRKRNPHPFYISTNLNILTDYITL